MSTVTLTAHQLQQALEFAMPNGDDQLRDTLVCIGPMPASLYGVAPVLGAWLYDDPQEGYLPLLVESSNSTPPPFKDKAPDYIPEIKKVHELGASSTPNFAVRTAGELWANKAAVEETNGPVWTWKDAVEAFIAGALYAESRKEHRKGEMRFTGIDDTEQMAAARKLLECNGRYEVTVTLKT